MLASSSIQSPEHILIQPIRAMSYRDIPPSRPLANGTACTCYLGSLPENPSAGYNCLDCLAHFIREPSFGTEVSVSNEPKDFVNGRVGREGAVVNGELPFEALRDVISSSTRMDHGGQELDVDNVGVVSRLLQAIEPIHLHELPNNFIGHL